MRGNRLPGVYNRPIAMAFDPQEVGFRKQLVKSLFTQGDSP